MKMRTRIFAILVLTLTTWSSVQNVSAQKIKETPIVYLVKDIKSGNAKKRGAALQRLVTLKPENPEDIDALVSLAHEKGDKTKTAAHRCLRNVSNKATNLRGKYAALLDAPSEDIQLSGIIGSRILQSKSTAPRIQLLLKGRRRHRIKKFGLGGARAADIEYVQQAAKALVELDDYTAVDEIMSRDAVMAIGSFGGPLVARWGARVLPKAVALAREKDSLRSDGALGIISSMRDEGAIPQLVKLIDEDDSSIGIAASGALCRMPITSSKNKELVEKEFERRLEHPQRFIRRYAYEGLLRHNPKKHLAAAMKAVQSDSDVRLGIFYALIKNPVPEAVPYLEQFIEEDEKKRPNWTIDRKVAAQVIFKTTGRRVDYQGVEEDRKIYPDPYDPSNK